MKRKAEDRELPGRTLGSEEAEEYLAADDEIEIRREQRERASIQARRHKVAMKF